MITKVDLKNGKTRKENKMKKVNLFIMAFLLMTTPTLAFKGVPSGKGMGSPPIAKQGNIYNAHNQLQTTWKTQPATKNVEFYSKHNQLEFIVKPDGTVMNRHNQKIGEIKPSR